MQTDDVTGLLTNDPNPADMALQARSAPCEALSNRPNTLRTAACNTKSEKRTPVIDPHPLPRYA